MGGQPRPTTTRRSPRWSGCAPRRSPTSPSPGRRSGGSRSTPGLARELRAGGRVLVDDDDLAAGRPRGSADARSASSPRSTRPATSAASARRRASRPSVCARSGTRSRCSRRARRAARRCEAREDDGVTVHALRPPGGGVRSPQHRGLLARLHVGGARGAASPGARRDPSTSSTSPTTRPRASPTSSTARRRTRPRSSCTSTARWPCSPRRSAGRRRTIRCCASARSWRTPRSRRPTACSRPARSLAELTGARLGIDPGRVIDVVAGAVDGERLRAFRRRRRRRRGERARAAAAVRRQPRRQQGRRDGARRLHPPGRGAPERNADDRRQRRRRGVRPTGRAGRPGGPRRARGGARIRRAQPTCPSLYARPICSPRPRATRAGSASSTWRRWPAGCL